jgi:UDP-N-acetyl-D-mannosaminuronate dehydrogenase
VSHPAGPTAAALGERIARRTARVGVVGLGYVGPPLAVEFARAGFPTIGIDLDGRKVDAIRQGTSHIADVPTAEVRRLVAEGRLEATTDFAVVADLDTVNICVPTPLRKTKDPDMTYKRDIDDIRESPSLDVMTLLHQKGATVQYADPYVPHLGARQWPGGVDLATEPVTAEALGAADCVLTDHSTIDYDMVRKMSRLVVDTRNAIAGEHAHVLRLGAPAASVRERLAANAA